MTKPNNDDIDIYELLYRADELLNEEEEDLLLREEDEEDFMGGPGELEPEIRIVYEEPVDKDATVVYRNAANNYGQTIRNTANTSDPVIRNAANNYGMNQTPLYHPQTPPAAPVTRPSYPSQPIQTPAPAYPEEPIYTQAPSYAPAPEPTPAPKAQPAPPAPTAKPTMAEKAVNSIRAYNADFRAERDRSAPKTGKKTTYTQSHTAPLPEIDPPAKAEKPEKKKRRKMPGCLTKLISMALVIALVVGLFNFFVRHPKTDSPLGNRRNGVSTILLCGADIGGDRTDTMMLLYVDSNKKQAGLLSLPRDTYTISAYGEAYKLNSAYGRNGGGEEGIEVLFDYVQKIIGYRPDGYMLIELPMLRDLVDLMGGVKFNVPRDMTSYGIDGTIKLEAGLQYLTGDQALGLIRYRYGYENQDLGRQDVQKRFLKACLEQWVTADNLGKIKEALSLVKAQSFTNLTTGNFAWFGLNLLRCGFSNIYTDTLPGYSTMIGDQSFYVLNPEEVASLIQDRYNPYKTEITREKLDIPTE